MDESLVVGRCSISDDEGGNSSKIKLTAKIVHYMRMGPRLQPSPTLRTSWRFRWWSD